MIESILKKINSLKGVQQACLYREGKDLVSTFPDSEHDNMVCLAKKMGNIFFALQEIDKSHDEISLFIDDQLIVAYSLYDSYIAILLTDKKINFSQIHMGIYSASSKIKSNIARSKKEN